jgi:hypothetical protein
MTDSKERLQVLLSEYENLRTDETAPMVELARLEHDIWDCLKVIEGRGLTKKAGRAGEMRDWFSTKYGGLISSYERRGAIFRAGEWAHQLFILVDKKRMSLTTAIDSVQKVKSLARQGVPPDRAIEAIIRDYDGTAKSIENIEIGPARKPKTEDETNNGLGSKSFKAKVMHLATEFMETATSEHSVEPVHKKKIMDEFGESVERVVLDFMHEIARKKGQAKKEGLEKIGNSRFGYSCEVLGLSAKFGAKLDIRRVSKAYKGRAAPLRRIVDVGHNSDSEAVKSARSELVAVNQAYEILRTYVKQKEL